MGKSNKVCPVCGKKMKQQFIGLQHCKYGMSWKKDIGFFELRDGKMVFDKETNEAIDKVFEQIHLIAPCGDDERSD